MANVSVVFPDKSQIGAKPVVIPGKTWVAKGDQVCWHVDCRNADIKYVRIAIDNPSRKYFPQTQNSAGVRSDWTQDVSSGRCLVWGVAPEAPVGGGEVRDKYTVCGLAADRKTVISSLDPEIITEDP